MWQSNDIWIRRGADGVAIHENPIYRPGEPNRVFVRVRNRGCGAAASGQVSLYWAKGSSSLAWPDPWDGSKTVSTSTGEVPLGGFIGTVDTGSVGAGESAVLEFAWEPPDPAAYAEFGADQTHFCLLAHLGSAPGTTIDLPQLVRGDNDIAWKNVSVVGEDPVLDSYVSVGGTAEYGTKRFVFEVPADAGTASSVFDWGTVSVDLGPLHELWVQGGSIGELVQPLGGTTVQLLGSGATLRGIAMAPSAFSTLRVVFTPDPDGATGDRVRPDVYQLSLKQYSELVGPDSAVDDLRLVGGQLFQLKVLTPISTLFPPPVIF